MSDRKYRQPGYRDEPRERGSRPSVPRKPPEPGAPAGARRISQDGPRNVQMLGYRQVVRCAQCGAVVTEEADALSSCARCGVDMHTCAQCTSLDPGSRFECMQDVPVRVAAKNERNTCTLFSPRTTVERETTAPRPNNARNAFDDLFKL